VVALLSSAACTDLDSATNLNPDGPPMIRQVRLTEVYMDAGGQLNERGPLFAFGTHPKVTSDDDAHPVTSAKAEYKNDTDRIRVIMDELLVGNNLEEIQCRGIVDDDDYTKVPLGTTPDDIAKCAVARDVLDKSCDPTSPHAVCICANDAGCGDVAKGKPVGVLDDNQDGAADKHRMMPGAVGIRCDSIDVPINYLTSYWNPSGDQNVPAKGGFDALGPALVLRPGPIMGTTAPAFLPTNTTCGLVFDPSVVDKQGIKVCAPPDGDITKNCSPGDVSAFSFKVEPLQLRNTSVQNDATGVPRMDPVELTFSAPLDPTTINVVTVTEGTTPYTQFTLSQPATDKILITWTGTLAANQPYTISVGTALKDLYKQAAPMTATLHFTTGM
jgi:hypothetical protein